MADFTFTWLGREPLAKLLAEGGDKIVPALAQALYEEGQLAFAESQRLVPRDTGTLAGSGVLKPPDVQGDHVTVSMGYGGAASDYALIVHEDPNATHTGGRTFKYLEVPVLARVPNMEANVSKRIERILGL